MTHLEIEQKLKEIENKMKAAIAEVEALADEKEVNVRIEPSQVFNSFVHKEWPILNLDSISIGYYNGLDTVARSIYPCINHPEYFLLQALKVEEVNEKKQEIKLHCQDYELWRIEYFGLPKDSLKVIKTFVNGNKICKFDDPEQFDKFMEIYNFTNPLTEKLLAAITDNDRVNFAAAKKTSRNFNIYYFVSHDLIERLNISEHWEDKQYYNKNLVIKALENK